MTTPTSIISNTNVVTNYSAEDIERIVNDFYSPTSHLSIEQRQQFNTILENLQDSKSAWDFSWKFFDITKSPSIQFFGAVALSNKISKHLSELDDQQIQELFQQLIQRLILFISISSKQIITKLTVALSHLILNRIANKWQSSIQSIITLFTQSQNQYLIQHPEKGHLLVLNLLTILPEEFSRTILSKSQRSLVRTELEKEFTTVVSYLQFIISTYNQCDILSQIYSCLSKWFEFGISILQIEIFFDYLFNSLTNQLLFSDVSDCLLVIFTSPDALKFPTVFSRLLSYVLQLETILDQCLITGDKDKAETVTRLIVQYGENLAQLIVQMALSSDTQSQTRSHQFCRLVMKCTDMKGQYPIEETSSELTFSFWHALKEEVTSMNDTTALEFFRPYFEHLIEVLIKKGKLPDNENVFTREDKDVFQSYRSDIIETMMCLYNIFDNRAMENYIKLVLANCLLLSIEQNQSWQIQESIIQLIGAGHEFIQPDENQILPRIFSLIPKLNFSNNTIINTTLIVLGQYSYWLGNHQDILENCVHISVNALSNLQLIPSASIALKELIKENRLYMSKYLNEIFPIMKNVLENIHVQSNDRIRCLSIIGYILSVHPSKIVLDHLNLLLAPEINKLMNYLSSHDDKTKKDNIYQTLHFISVLITALGYDDGNESKTIENTNNTVEVLSCVLRDLDPIFHLILKQYGDDVQITEKICEILSRTVTILQESSSLLLNTYLQILQNMGSNILHMEFLNFIRNTLLFFAKDTDKPVHNLFLAVLQKFGYLFHGDQQWLHNHVDTVEDIANFFSQVIKKLPNIVNHCSDEGFILLIQFMKIGIQLHEQGPVKSISTLISNFIEYTKLNQQAADLFQQNGYEFVQILLKCIGGSSPRNLIEYLSFPLFTLSKSYLNWTKHWVERCLNDPNFPTSSAKQQHREALLKILTSERTSRANFKDHINTFATACRQTVS